MLLTGIWGLTKGDGRSHKGPSHGGGPARGAFGQKIVATVRYGRQPDHQRHSLGKDRVQMKLADYANGRDNNLNLLRMLAAFGVLVSHAYPIALGPDAVQPLVSWLGMSLGSVCVYIFFIISGFLITQSFERSRNIHYWAAGRVLRLFPALIVVVLLTALLLGPAVTTLSSAQYFRDPSVGTYVLRNIALVSLQYELPGVFETNPYGGAINGSLWTLVHEAACYTFVLLCGVLGFLGSPRRLLVFLVISFAGFVLLEAMAWREHLHDKIAAFLRLAVPFGVGMALYALRRWLPLSPLMGLVLLPVCALAYPTLVGFVAFNLCLGYWVFLLAYLPSGRIRAYNRVGDYSYGIYIYAFPAQQLSMFLFPGLTPLENVLIAGPVTLGLAALSWYLVEKPSLGRKEALGATLTDMASRAKPAKRS